MPRAEIATKQASHTLLQLHAELAGKIIDNRKEAERLRQAMRHVEAVLKLRRPGYDVRPIAVRRRKVNKWFKRGTLLRHALDVLRGAERPLTTREIVSKMLAARGVTDAKPQAVRDLCTSATGALRSYEGRVVIGDGKHPTRWTIRP